MPDYNHLRELCLKSTEISTEALDEFLIYYAAGKDKLDEEFETRLSRFKQPIRPMPASWIRMLKSQYIGHRIFKQGGLIQKYLNHQPIKDLETDQLNYLKTQAARPWRFSFSVILDKPAVDFYFMEDVFTGETYLLYSRSVGLILETHAVMLWFNLIGYNGECWQTYGPLAHYNSFDADDIFFYATEVNAAIDAPEKLTEDVEKNPMPYMVLMTGSGYPLSIMQGHEMVHVISETPIGKLDVATLKNDFKIEYADGIFKLSQDLWSEPPHLAEVYYEEENGIIYVFALTDLGFKETVKNLNAHGVSIPEEADIRLHLTMLTLIEKLLKKEIVLNPFIDQFEIPTTPESDEMMDRMNQLLALALPYINADQDPDIAKLAKEAGVDPETARQILEPSIARAKELRSMKGPFR